MARGPSDNPGGVDYGRAFGSAHPGVVNFVIGDGAVRPISTSIQQDTLPTNMTTNTMTLAGGRGVLTLLTHTSDGQSITIP